MSLVLKAFPMAFLINPDSDSDITCAKSDLNLGSDSLALVKVATNLSLEDVNRIMENIDIPYKYYKDAYVFEDGMKLEWSSYNGYYCANLSLNDVSRFSAKKINPASYLVKQGEELFKNFDVILKKNVRNVNSKEIFYYCYKTPYNQKEDIVELLQKNKIENIARCTNLEISFRFDGKNYKYLRKSKSDFFYLESEQCISLLNLIRGAKPVTSRTLKTNFTDRDILIKTLEEYGADNIESDKYNVSCNLFGMYFLYSKNNAQSSYDLEINKITDEDGCTKILNDLKDEYSSNVQDVTYRRIIERIKSHNLRIESEEIDEDNSIVLTIDVG